MSGENAPSPELLAKLQELAQKKQELDASAPERPTEAPQPVIVVPKIEVETPPAKKKRKRRELFSPERLVFMRSYREEFAEERAQLKAEVEESCLAIRNEYLEEFLGGYRLPTLGDMTRGAAPAARGDALRRLGVRPKVKP